MVCLNNNTLPVLVLAMLLCGCESRRSTALPNLRAVIVNGNSTQYCQTPVDRCTNPHILGDEEMLRLTYFVDGTPQHSSVRTEELAHYLTSLPISAWPRGPSITLSPADVFSGPDSRRRIDQNLAEAERICRSLGLDIEHRMGADSKRWGTDSKQSTARSTALCKSD